MAILATVAIAAAMDAMTTVITLLAKMCEMRDERSGTVATPEGPKKTVTQSRGFKVFVCVLVCEEKERDRVRASRGLHIWSRKIWNTHVIARL